MADRNESTGESFEYVEAFHDRTPHSTLGMLSRYCAPEDAGRSGNVVMKAGRSWKDLAGRPVLDSL